MAFKRRCSYARNCLGCEPMIDAKVQKRLDVADATLTKKSFGAALGLKGTSGGASNYGSGFLPTEYGGVPFRPAGDPVLYLSNPKGIDAETQRTSLDSLNRL